MHAVVWQVTLDPEREEEIQKTLHEMLVPMTKASAGFQKGFWLRNSDNDGLAVVLYDTREHAEAEMQGSPPEEEWTGPVQPKSVGIYSVEVEA
jgi:hypothetical protein